MATILIVDDVKTDRDLLGKVVSGSGHNVAFATDGDEAVPKAKEVKPALIFLDVVMPRTDGFAACRLLKKDPETQGIPVVFVTSKSTDADKFWGKKQGAEDHIGKPFTPDSVAAVIRKYVK